MWEREGGIERRGGGGKGGCWGCIEMIIIKIIYEFKGILFFSDFLFFFLFYFIFHQFFLGVDLTEFFSPTFFFFISIFFLVVFSNHGGK